MEFNPTAYSNAGLFSKWISTPAIAGMEEILLLMDVDRVSFHKTDNILKDLRELRTNSGVDPTRSNESPPQDTAVVQLTGYLLLILTLAHIQSPIWVHEGVLKQGLQEFTST